MTRPRRRRRPFALYLAVAWLAIVAFLGVAVELLPLANYEDSVGDARMRPGWRIDEPLGTDHLGRSELSRIAYGARVSLTVGIVAVALGLVLGLVVGITSGYFRGRWERIVSVLLDSMLAFPPLILLLAIAAIWQPSLMTVTLGLAVLTVPAFSRLARSNTLVFSQREFVRAARAMGARDRRILVRELLPNVLRPVLSYAFIVIATVMVAESSLSFLGLGIPPPYPSWGSMIAAGRQSLQRAPYMVVVPATFLLVTVLSLNVVGDRALRHFDVRATAGMR